MKRLISIIIMMTACLPINAQDIYYHSSRQSNSDYARMHSIYLNNVRRNGAAPRKTKVVYRTVRDTIYVEKPVTKSSTVMTVASTNPDSMQIATLSQRITMLEQQLVGQTEESKPLEIKDWMNKYSSGDCLIKSGRANYAMFATLVIGAGVTGGLIYASTQDSEKSKDLRAASIATGAATGLISLIFYFKSVKWKIRAGKKSNMELEMKGNTLALNF